MSHHAKEEHSASLALTQADPQTVRFQASFDVGETEKTKVAENEEGQGN